MELTEIGRTGRPHGTRGELKLLVDEIYLDDLRRARGVLIGQPPVPYFVEQFTGGGAPRVRLERFGSREAVRLLSNQPLFLPADRVTVVAEPEETPWDGILGYTIRADNYPDLGPVECIIDLPSHYLAELTHGGREVLIPLHEDLVLAVDNESRVVRMDLPGGLLDL